MERKTEQERQTEERTLQQDRNSNIDTVKLFCYHASKVASLVFWGRYGFFLCLFFAEALMEFECHIFPALSTGAFVCCTGCCDTVQKPGLGLVWDPLNPPSTTTPTHFGVHLVQFEKNFRNPSDCKDLFILRETV